MKLKRRDTPRDRGVSFTFSYVLTIGITAVLLIGIIATAGVAVTEQRDRSLRDSFNIISQDMTQSIQQTERAVDVEGSVSLRTTREYPSDIAGSSYIIKIESTPDGGIIRLESNDGDVVQTYPVRTELNIIDSAAGGGTVQLEYDSATGLSISGGSR